MSDMQQFWSLVVIAGALAVGVTLLSLERARRRREQLQRQFGPEYERTVARVGDVTEAERELEERTRRVEHFHFHELSPVERARFATRWNTIQAGFAVDPAVAVTATNELINEVMRARGYPTLSFEQRVADLSVEHPLVVEHYRAAHDFSGSVFNGVADTERLRQALVHYRKLFVELLHESSSVSAPPAPLRRSLAA
ncbi:MAG: hypothetical protein EOO73_36095 [Myxococcales bacterium]|nr:MAG: hypothetical protein EOO73_36095 [Myxococcales bacterium]